jgi:hypothetical protein
MIGRINGKMEDEYCRYKEVYTRKNLDEEAALMWRRLGTEDMLGNRTRGIGKRWRRGKEDMLGNRTR